MFRVLSWCLKCCLLMGTFPWQVHACALNTWAETTESVQYTFSASELVTAASFGRWYLEATSSLSFGGSSSFYIHRCVGLFDFFLAHSGVQDWKWQIMAATPIFTSCSKMPLHKYFSPASCSLAKKMLLNYACHTFATSGVFVLDQASCKK